MVKRIQLFALAMMIAGLTACGGGSPNGSTSPPGGVIPPGEVLGDDEFRFAGKAPGAGPGAKVVAVIGEERFAGETDSQENFEIDVPLENLSADVIVRFHVRGTGSREHIEWHVAAPDAQRLRVLAGDDRTLTGSEFVDMTLSEIAVGRYARLFIANGGKHLVEPERFRQLQRDLVDGNDVLLSAGVLRKVLQGSALPAQTQTIWQLLTQEAAFGHFVESVRTTQQAASGKTLRGMQVKTDDPFGQVIEELLEDDEPFTPDEIPETYLLTEISRSTLDMKGGFLRFNPDGTGEHVNAAGTNTMTWTVNESGELVISPAPGKHADFVTIGSLLLNSDKLKTHRQELTGDIVLRRLRQGDYADLLTMQYTITEEILEPEFSGFWPPKDREFLKAVTAVRPDGHGTFAETELADTTWAMPGIAMGVTQAYEHPAQQLIPHNVHVRDEGLIEFHADGTGVVLAATTGDFTWTVSEAGFLQLEFADGSVTEYRKLRQDGPAHDLAVLLEDPESGERYVNAGLALPVDPDATFGDLIPDTGSFNGNFMLFGDAEARFDLLNTYPLIIELFADGTARRPPWQAGNGLDNYRNKAWYLDGNALLLDAIGVYYSTHPGRVGDSTLAPSCDPEAENETEEDCYLASRYHFQPLHQDGERMYVLETEDTYWYAFKDHELYGQRATRKTSVSFWELTEEVTPGSPID